jgi:hypothetical protein
MIRLDVAEMMMIVLLGKLAEETMGHAQQIKVVVVKQDVAATATASPVIVVRMVHVSEREHLSATRIRME